MDTQFGPTPSPSSPLGGSKDEEMKDVEHVERSRDMQYTEEVDGEQEMEFREDEEADKGEEKINLPNSHCPLTPAKVPGSSQNLYATPSSAGREQQTQDREALKLNPLFQIRFATIRYFWWKMWMFKCLTDRLFLRFQWARLHGWFYLEHVDPNLTMFRKAEVTWFIGGIWVALGHRAPAVHWIKRGIMMCRIMDKMNKEKTRPSVKVKRLLRSLTDALAILGTEDTALALQDETVQVSATPCAAAFEHLVNQDPADFEIPLTQGQPGGYGGNSAF